MLTKKAIRSTWLVVIISLTSCAAAAIKATEHGAKGEVKGSVQEVDSRTQTVLQDMGVRIVGTQMKNSGKEQDISGKAGKMDVSVTITYVTPGASDVEVTSKQGFLDWNKDYSKGVLNHIVAAS